AWCRRKANSARPSTYFPCRGAAGKVTGFDDGVSIAHWAQQAHYGGYPRSLKRTPQQPCGPRELKTAAHAPVRLSWTPLPRRVYRAVPQIAELAPAARRAEEDDLVLSVVIGIDEVRLPAASVEVSTAPAFDADERGGRHGHDDAANRRGAKVARRDSSRTGDGDDDRGARPVALPIRANICS
ncbi:MAG: hypothetical protein ACRELD_16950, partial [Longimicrobiales bacterium]